VSGREAPAPGDLYPAAPQNSGTIPQPVSSYKGRNNWNREGTVENYNYIIIGGGMAADSAARGIRQIDPNGTIAIFSRESDPPYNRPPLSKGLWARTRLKQIYRNTDQLGVELHLTTHVQSLQPEMHTIRTGSGESFGYDRLLLATGSVPNLLAPPSTRIFCYRTLHDYLSVRQFADTGAKFLLVGGGFIGLEMAAALSARGNPVTFLYRDQTPAARIFPEEIGSIFVRKLVLHGVELQSGTSVQSVSESAMGVSVQTTSGQVYRADALLYGIGVRPDTVLAMEAGLEVDRGIRVNRFLQTSHPDIYAAGDVCEFFNLRLSTWMRVEHEDHANQSGLVAGQNMAGQSIEYAYLPYFYTDVFSDHFYGIGEINPELRTRIDWIEPDRRAILYYFSPENRIRGIVLMNLPYSEIETARQLISAPARMEPYDYRKEFKNVG
jgi:NADPH-dependent 2,4-dienoyl-CoA reductase/sulfur reductase-like enzyme